MGAQPVFSRPHPWRKLAFLFPSSHPLSIAPQLGVGLCDHLATSSQGFAWLDLSRVSCTMSTTMSSMCYELLCLERTLYHCGHPWPLILTVPPPYLLWALWALGGGGLMWMSYLGWVFSTVSYSLHIDQWGLRDAWVSGCNDASLGVSFILCPFSRLVVAGSPLEPMT